MGEDLTFIESDLSGLEGDAEGLEGDVEDDDEDSGSAQQQQQPQGGVSIRVNTAPLRQLAKDFRGLGAAVREELAKSLRIIADDVADTARARARGMERKGPGTDRMANSIRVLGADKSLRVVGGGARAPELAPIDHGGRPGSFRHPVFGNQDVWVSQRAVRILEPTPDQEAAAQALALQAIDRALRRTGFG